MGREWYFSWGSKSSSAKKTPKTGGGGAVKTPAPPPPPPGRGDTVAAAAAAMAAGGGEGCMSAVLNLLDFHHFQFCLHPHDANYGPVAQNAKSSSFFAQDPTSLKGLETPRKSMDTSSEKSTKPPRKSLDTSSEKSKPRSGRRDTNLKVAIQPLRDHDHPHRQVDDTSSEGARTPNLVARLMGLDILPDPSTTTPRTSHSQSQSVRGSPLPNFSSPPSSNTSNKTRKALRPRSSYSNDAPGPRSLPDTPGSSSSSFSKPPTKSPTTRESNSVVLERHRLSLEFNKENSLVKEMESSRPSCSAISTKKRDHLGRRGENNHLEEETRSPRYYARQIMKQVKETVSRRRSSRTLGTDITNTLHNNKEHRRDEHLLVMNSISQSTKAPPPKKSANKKYSSRLKPIEQQQQQQPSSFKFSLDDDSEESSSLQDTYLEPVPKPTESNPNKQDSPKARSVSDKSCSKKPPKSVDPIRKKKEEQFIRPQTRVNDKKSKKTQLPSMVPVKKDLIHSSSPSPTRLPHSQETPPWKALSQSSSQWRCKKQKDNAIISSSSFSYSSSSSSMAEFQYISKILKCTGIDRDTPVSLTTTWFSPTSPLDPSLFHHLETTHFAPGTISYYDHSNNPSEKSCLSSDKRRLIFHLVDEILADILNPMRNKLISGVSSSNPSMQEINGCGLVKMLCKRIENIPSSNCETFQDIDFLVEKDLPRFDAQNSAIAFEEDAEAIVSEIEHEIVDSLIQEIAVFFMVRQRISMQRYVTVIRV